MKLTTECNHCGRKIEFEIDESILSQSLHENPFMMEIECGYEDCGKTSFMTGQLTELLTREEAAAFGLKIGQVKELQWMPDEGQLFSEDLY